MSDYEAVRREVARRLRGRVVFYLHVITFTLSLLVVLTQQPWMSGNMSFHLLWGGILLFHAARTFRWWGNYVDRATEREMARRNATYAALSEKPKRDARLGDDGELEYLDEEVRTKRKSTR